MASQIGQRAMDLFDAPRGQSGAASQFEQPSQTLAQSGQNTRQLLRMLQAPSRLGIDGNLEDVNAPTGIDWLGAHNGTGGHSWEQPGMGEMISPEQQHAMQVFNHSHPLELDHSGHAQTDQGEVGVHNLGLGDQAAPSMVEGIPAAQWFQTHGTAGGNPNEVAHLQHLSPDQLGLYNQDVEYHNPRSMADAQGQRNQAATTALRHGASQVSHNNAMQSHLDTNGATAAATHRGGVMPADWIHRGQGPDYEPFGGAKSVFTPHQAPPAMPQMTGASAGYNPFQAGMEAQPFQDTAPNAPGVDINVLKYLLGRGLNPIKRAGHAIVTGGQ